MHGSAQHTTIRQTTKGKERNTTSFNTVACDDPDEKGLVTSANDGYWAQDLGDTTSLVTTATTGILKGGQSPNQSSRRLDRN